MRLILLSLLSLACLPGDTVSQVPKVVVKPGDVILTLPAQVTGAANSFITVPATTDGRIVRWVSLDSNLNLFPVELLKDTHTAVVTGPAGSYRLLAYTADATGTPSMPATCVVVIGGAPVPPGPTPPVPGPSDPFFATLSAAWAQETSPGKAAQANALMVCYQRGAYNAVNNKALATVGDFWTAFKRDVDGVLAATDLPHVRPVLGAELSRVLPTSTTAALDDGTRNLIATHYTRIAADLGGLK